MGPTATKLGRFGLRCSGWSLLLLSGNLTLNGAMRMKARRNSVSNGGLDCRWLHYEIR